MSKKVLMLSIMMIILLLMPALRGECQSNLSNNLAVNENKEDVADGLIKLEGKLSIDDALKISLQNNKDLQMALEGRTIAKGRIWEAYGEALPQISLNGSYTRLDEVLSFEFNGMKIDLGFINNYSTSLNVVQPLYRGGRTGAAIRASKLYKALVDADIRQMMIQTIYNTMKAYYAAVLAQRQADVTAKYVELAEAHEKDVEIKKKYGVASDFNVLRSKVELSNARSQYINYKNQQQVALINLLRVIGVSQSSDVELVDQLEYSPVQISEMEAYRIAFENRPDLDGARITAKLQEEALVAAKSNYIPSVDAFFTWNLSKPDPHISMINEWGSAWRAGITFNFNIFDGLRREGQLIREKAVLNQYRLNYLKAKEQIRFEVTAAFKSLKNAQESLEVQKLTLEQANEALRLANVGYREGILDQVSVLEAHTSMTQAQLIYYSSLYNYLMAKLDLMRAIGKL
jgi:outer membrane protein TolC